MLIKDSKYLTLADLLAFPLHQYVTVLLQTNFVRNATELEYIFNYLYVKWNTVPKHSLKYTLIWITGFVNSPPLYSGGQTPRVPTCGVTLQYINNRIHWHNLPLKKNVKIIIKILQYRMATRVLKSTVLVISLLN